jgi:hypothetical protein
VAGPTDAHAIMLIGGVLARLPVENGLTAARAIRDVGHDLVIASVFTHRQLRSRSKGCPDVFEVALM